MPQNYAYFEHRACCRYSVRERSSVVLLPENINSERILDVSEKGIAFCYYGGGLEARINDQAVINLRAQGLGLSSVAVRIVSDCKIKTVDDEGLRRCGLEFVEISKDQLQLIKEVVATLF